MLQFRCRGFATFGEIPLTMARRLSDDKIKLSIVINGNEAQKEILDLEKANISLKESLSDQLKEQKKLQRQKKTDTADYKTLTAEINKNEAAVKRNNQRIKELKSSLDLTDKTMSQLRSEATMLRATLSHLIPGTEDYKRYEAELQKVNARMGELRGNAQQAKWSIGSLADNFNRYAALGASIVAGVTGVVLSIQKILDFNAKLSDSISNVQKTTGMTKKEVEDLAKSFGMLKTRTSRIELLGIAEIGGRLGIAKQEIGDFVKVMNKASVALGDSFEGGASQVAEQLGRIKGLYAELRDVGVEQAFEAVGSALNDLGAAGTASEDNVSQFVQIVGTIPGKMRPTVKEALGLGAAFEESGLKAEIAGNNYSKFITIAARDVDKFATVMGRPAKELEELINTNPTEFFFQFSKSIKGLDATQLAKILDYLKLNDQQVKQVLGAASENVELFRDKIRLAGESMAEATSLTAEYDIKNNNLAATMERLRKTVLGWFTSDSVVAFIEAGVNWFAKFVGAMEDTEGNVSAFRNTLAFLAKVVGVVTAALITNAAWTQVVALTTKSAWEASKLYTLGLKARVLMENLGIIASQAYAAVTMLLTGNIKGATQAIRVMAATMKTTPWGLVLSMVAAVAAAYILFAEKGDKATRQQKMFNDVAAETAIAVKKEKDLLQQRLKIVNDTNRSDKEREKALKDIIALNPEMLKGLTLQNAATKEGKKLIDDYIVALEKSARAKAVASKITELYSQILDIEKSNLKDNISYFEMLWNTMKSGATMPGGGAMLNVLTAINNKNASIQEIQDVIDSLLKEQANYDATVNIKTKSKDDGGSAIVPGDEKAEDKARKRRDDQRKKDLDDLQKARKAALDLERDAIDERLELIEDGYDKQEALEAEKHKRRLADLKQQLVNESEIAKLNARIDAPETSVVDRANLVHIREYWLEENKHINELIELEEGRHQLAMETISINAENKRFDDLQQQFDKETIARETAHNYAMAALGENEKGKKKLQEQFNKEELYRQSDFLKQMVAQLQAVINDQNNAIDFDLLTPEQKKQFEEEIAQLKLKISEIIKAKAELQGEGGSDDFGVAAGNVFGDADILGFTVDQWEQTFDSLDTLEEKLAAVKMGTSALQNAWGAYSDFVSAQESARLNEYERNAEAKKRKLKWQLDNGYISQVEYRRSMSKLETDYEKKKAELEYKAAKRKRTIDIVEAIVNTAKGVTSALQSPWPLSLVFAALAAATGALQIATIKQQPLPARGYEEGLYPEYVKREQDGKMFNAKYGGKTRSGMVNKPTYFLAGENGPEMVIDSKAYREMSPETKSLLIRELRGIKGFEKGFYSDEVKNPRFEVPADTSLAPKAAQDVSKEYLLKVIERNTQVMEKIFNEGLVAYVSRDPRDIKKLIEEQDKIKDSKEKARV
ncbi:phage tail tape measure protein [Flavobacterium rhizosphaerae]|uniref:Phage tail tape measure protein n=1 Tax=Flavobacterium rhizosphaerae TaxID=3163298 RepID=A0ABW8Z035_9FLAO